jgi:hypothetical protein
MPFGRWGLTVVLFTLAATLSGCLPHALYQSPRALSEGEYSFGAGLACVSMIPSDEGLMYTGSAYYRTGIGDNSDGGVALHFTRANCVTLAGDSRWQLTEGPFLVTARTGVALAYWWGDRLFDIALEPGLLLGTDRVWFSVSCPLNWLLGGIWLPAPSPYVGLGARIGDRLQFLPELGCNLTFSGDDLSYGSISYNCILGLGVQYDFGLGQESDDLFGLRRGGQPRMRCLTGAAAANTDGHGWRTGS